MPQPNGASTEVQESAATTATEDARSGDGRWILQDGRKKYLTSAGALFQGPAARAAALQEATGTQVKELEDLEVKRLQRKLMKKSLSSRRTLKRFIDKCESNAQLQKQSMQAVLPCHMRAI